MSFVLAASVLLQFSAALLVIGTLRWRAFGLVGAAFVLIAVVYHGASEVLYAVGLAPNQYRLHVTQAAVDDWIWIVSIAILVMTIAYVLVLGELRESRIGRADVRLFSWPALLLAAAPLYGLAVTGRASSDSGYWLGGLTTQFLVLLIVLASFDFLRRRDARYFVPVVAAQSILLAPVGSRWSIIAAGLLTAWALVRVGKTPTRRQVAMTLALVLLAGAVISSSRVVAAEEQQEHFSLATGARASIRLNLIAQGIEKLPVNWTRSAFWSDWVYRVDGNALPALAHQAENRRQAAPLGVGRLAEAPLIAVPRFAYSGKHSGAVLDEKEALVRRFSVTRRADFLNPTLGMLYAYLGVPGLWLVAALAGVAFAVADRWLQARATPARLLVGLGLMLCVLLYEQGVQVYPLNLRGIAVLVALLAGLQAARSALSRMRGRAPTSGMSPPSPPSSSSPSTAG